ncbi:hypothetical protein [Peribacillus muralis]|nr:hypothetical protein [Peribacillus muralis]
MVKDVRNEKSGSKINNDVTDLNPVCEFRKNSRYNSSYLVK